MERNWLEWNNIFLYFSIPLLCLSLIYCLWGFWLKQSTIHEIPALWKGSSRVWKEYPYFYWRLRVRFYSYPSFRFCRNSSIVLLLFLYILVMICFEITRLGEIIGSTLCSLYSHKSQLWLASLRNLIMNLKPLMTFYLIAHLKKN